MAHASDPGDHSAGSAIGEDDVWFDGDVLRRWNVDNLEGYWRGRLGWMRRMEPTDALVRGEHGLQWVVLGSPRLHSTITTLGITSKSGAGRYALGIAEGRWRMVIEAAMALRLGRTVPLPASPDELCRDAIDLLSWLIRTPAAWWKARADRTAAACSQRKAPAGGRGFRAGDWARAYG